jgi:hypothetical protein
LLETIFLTVANPFLLRIWDNLDTSEIDSPIPSICTVPCFLRTSLERKMAWLSLESLLTL